MDREQVQLAKEDQGVQGGEPTEAMEFHHLMIQIAERLFRCSSFGRCEGTSGRATVAVYPFDEALDCPKHIVGILGFVFPVVAELKLLPQLRGVFVQPEFEYGECRGHHVPRPFWRVFEAAQKLCCTLDLERFGGVSRTAAEVSCEEPAPQCLIEVTGALGLDDPSNDVPATEFVSCISGSQSLSSRGIPQPAVEVFIPVGAETEPHARCDSIWTGRSMINVEFVLAALCIVVVLIACTLLAQPARG